MVTINRRVRNDLPSSQVRVHRRLWQLTLVTLLCRSMVIPFASASADPKADMPFRQA